MEKSKVIPKLFNILLSEKRKEELEKVTLVIAIVSYLIHLLIIFLNIQGVIEIEQKFFKNPIAAIYTPFSFILIFEVFLLVYYLPKSITAYIGKQYEIITLIVIRKIFKDLAYVELDSNWFQNQDDLQFTIDVLTSLILFFVIYLFYRAIRKRDYVSINKLNDRGKNIRKFVLLKQVLAIILVPILFVFAFYSLINWGVITANDYSNGILEFSNINNVFFDEFFNILIIIDVLLLLASFFYSDKFYKIIRNSGFVISTILIKISFSSVGLAGNVLIISSVLFGYLILIIHNLYEENALSNES
ncbi:hypothetical protein OAG16_00590 [Saprospiraceae bacterium]|nr:hypothetical protein [bacterium]MDB4539819.1 hypothetical protein [Saprospiraceae bacterium]MDB4768544.1 hypothetical protein [Saprospiraceae bacterium]MDC3253555.1 hypothetical protein [bacterium]